MSDPIYIVSGKEVTKSQLAKTAAARGIPLDKYITLAGATLSGKTTVSKYGINFGKWFFGASRSI